MADESLPPLAQAKGVLKMTPTGQQWHRQVECQRYRLWRIATRTTQQLLTSSGDACYGVVAAHLNLAIMRQHAFFDSCQPLPGVIVLVSNCLFAQIATSHD